MADLSNLKISNTFSRLLQADPDTNQLQDGVGSNPSTIIFNGTTLKYVDGNQQNNYILTSDANGVARWAANSGGGGGDTNVYWSASSLNANDIVNSGMTNSKVGIGTLIPNHTLTVSGTVSGSSHFYGGGDMTLIRNLSVGNNLVVTGNTVMNGTLSASSVNVGNGDGSVSAATITASGEIDGGSLDIEGDADINGTTNLDAVDIDGNVQLDGTLTVGVNDTGYDVKFFGASDGRYLHWDEDEDELILGSSTKLSFHDSQGDENIVASSDGHLEINAGTTLDITAPTVMTSAKLRVGSDLIVTGNTVMDGTLSATTSLKVGNGDGSVSAATITGNTLVAGGRLAIKSGGSGIRVADLMNVDTIAYGYDGTLRHYTYGKSVTNIHGFTGSTFMFGNGAGTLSSSTINAETINGTTVEGTIDGGTF